MLGRIAVVVGAVAVGAMLAGCGGSPDVVGPPAPPAGGGVQSHEIGPLIVRTASAAGFVAREIPNPGGAVTLTALYGSEVTYLASQALLDRIVFASDRSGGINNLWICDLNGSNAVQLTDNTANETHPCWSPDGTVIAFDRRWPSQDAEIMTVNADGSGVRALTNNAVGDRHASFGPEGRRVAFQRENPANTDIYVIYTNGSGATNLTNHGAWDGEADWSPDLTDSKLLFSTNRDGVQELYEMNDDGSAQTRITNSDVADSSPDYHPFLSLYACERYVQANWEIATGRLDGGRDDNFSATPGNQYSPSWSSNGRFICYQSGLGGDFELVLQEADLPLDKFAITRNGSRDAEPDLGSPTMQTDRVIIGPPGSDWGGADPIWSSCYAGIAAWDDRSYVNFVRIGLRPGDLGSLSISPLTRPAQSHPVWTPAVVLVEAAKIVNLREDAGRGLAATVWDLDALDLTAAVLYFHTGTGKLVSVMALRDTTYPSGAGSPGAAVSQRAEGDRLVVEGDFSAAFDAQGERVAGDGTTRVVLGAGGEVESAN